MGEGGSRHNPNQSILQRPAPSHFCPLPSLDVNAVFSPRVGLYWHESFFSLDRLSWTASITWVNHQTWILASWVSSG